MTQNVYRTTKIPDYYFSQIEDYLSHTTEFVSVSEFIRDSVKEKLNRVRNVDFDKFLIVKDVVFNEDSIEKLHREIIGIKEDVKVSLLKDVSMQSIVNRSADMDSLKFLSKILVNFAYVHPFEDGNKRTSWIAVDVFLRLNNKKLDLKSEKIKETDDERFIWHNSTNQKKTEDVIKFLEAHIVEYANSSKDFDTEVFKSLEENKLLLKKLAR